MQATGSQPTWRLFAVNKANKRTSRGPTSTVRSASPVSTAASRLTSFEDSAQVERQRRELSTGDRDGREQAALADLEVERAPLASPAHAVGGLGGLHVP